LVYFELENHTWRRRQHFSLQTSLKTAVVSARSVATSFRRAKKVVEGRSSAFRLKLSTARGNNFVQQVPTACPPFYAAHAPWPPLSRPLPNDFRSFIPFPFHSSRTCRH